MAWEYHNGIGKLNLKKGDKVKTQLTPFKCSIGETVEDDNIIYKKSWVVESVNSDSIILKSGKEIMITTLSGHSLGEWIHHRVYKINSL